MIPGDTADKVCTIITEHLSCADRFTWDASLREDLGADSLDIVELTFELEEAFGYPIPGSVPDRWRTPQDLLDTVGEFVS